MGKSLSKKKTKKMSKVPKKIESDILSSIDDGDFVEIPLPEPGTPIHVSTSENILPSNSKKEHAENQTKVEVEVPSAKNVALDEIVTLYDGSSTKTQKFFRPDTPITPKSIQDMLFQVGNRRVIATRAVIHAKMPSIAESVRPSTPQPGSSKPKLSIKDELGIKEIQNKLPWLSDIENFKNEDMKLEFCNWIPARNRKSNQENDLFEATEEFLKQKQMAVRQFDEQFFTLQEETDSSLNESVSLEYEKSSSSRSGDMQVYMREIVSHCIEKAIFISEVKAAQVNAELYKIFGEDRSVKSSKMEDNFPVNDQYGEPGTSNDLQFLNWQFSHEEPGVHIISETKSVRFQKPLINSGCKYAKCLDYPEYFPTVNLYFSPASYVESESGEARSPNVKFGELDIPKVALKPKLKGDETNENVKFEHEMRTPSYISVLNHAGLENDENIEESEADRIFKKTRYFQHVSQYKPDLCISIPPRTDFVIEGFDVTPPTLTESSSLEKYMHKEDSFEPTIETNTMEGLYAKINKPQTIIKIKEKVTETVDVGTNTTPSLEKSADEEKLEMIRREKFEEYIRKSALCWKIVYNFYAFFSLIIVIAGYYALYYFFLRARPESPPIIEDSKEAWMREHSAMDEEYEFETDPEKTFQKNYWYLPFLWCG